MAKLKKLTKSKSTKPSSRQVLKQWRQRYQGRRDTSGVPLKGKLGMTQEQAVASLRKRFDRKCSRFSSYDQLEAFWLRTRIKFIAKFQKNISAAREAETRRFQGSPDSKLEKKITHGKDLLRKEIGYVERWMQTCADKLNSKNPALKHPVSF
jgi:hypothetical protein